MRPLAVVSAVLAAATVAATAASAAERLDGEAIRRAFEGNTVAGRYSGSNQPFSEHHHPDGRATGHNRHVPNRDACWTTTADAVCYYYGSPAIRRTYCFTVERSDRLYILRSRPSGAINGMATIEPGDPQGASDGPANWSCDGLISGGPAGTHVAGR
ncbi:hypothetical protein [Bosea sp. 124]|uniref:hypothetical protein n=1 Tax=Bosea sp. 124 TaxID=2135642 RepID=UPI000D3DC58F|nr:hypothetical protein [Bosea sp. 124]PTM38659.1 hypothetical protein C8D03_0132 [Bosea sp. 124]